MNSKPVNITLIGNAQKEFTTITNKIILNSIKQKIEFLKNDPEYSIHISKNKIPKTYIKEYDINNIWKVNLPNAWRMLYTLRGSETSLDLIIIDILNHRDYEKKFGYKRS